MKGAFNIEDIASRDSDYVSHHDREILEAQQKQMAPIAENEAAASDSSAEISPAGRSDSDSNAASPGAGALVTTAEERITEEEMIPAEEDIIPKSS